MTPGEISEQFITLGRWEPELERRRADLTMSIRPNARRFEILDNLLLRGYAVVSLGFERIWWEEVGREGGEG